MSPFLWNFYPPFWAAGIRITAVGPAYSFLEARLTLHWWNKNYVGSLFGGSIYSLCDPFHMVLLIHRLGPKYKVRDKGAEVKFLKKGLGTVKARFEIPAETLEKIRICPEAVQECEFGVEVKDEAGEVVATVRKFLHVRRLT